MLKIDKPILVGNEDRVLERISTEREGLRDNLDKLTLFMKSDIFKKLPEHEQELLYEQKFCMKNLIEVLLCRIIEMQDRIKNAKQ